MRPTTTITAEVLGDPVRFECFADVASAWTCSGILQGKTYPVLPVASGVRVVLDVGANCGAATVLFAHAYPDARILAVEPAPDTFEVLGRNTAALANVEAHQLALAEADGELPLYEGDGDTGMRSLFRRDCNTDEHQLVTVRHAGDWVREQHVDRIDIVKVDVEGAEPAVLAGLGELLAGAQVVYVEFDSRADRRRIDDLLRPTHDLTFGMLLPGQGELVYVREDLLDAAGERSLQDLARQRLTAAMT